MENKEKNAIQRCHLDLVKDLNPDDILPYLFQFGFLAQCQYEELTEMNLTRRRLCQRFLNVVTSGSSRCTFQGLLKALRYENTYSFLADKLERQLRIEKENRVENGANGQTGNNHQQQQSRNIEPLHERSREGLSTRVNTRNGETAGIQMFQQVRKIDVFKENRVKMSQLAHKLKQLSHDGDMDKFRRYVSNIHKRFNHDKLNASKDIEARMEMADMKFIALEAEASSRRVQYDVTLYGNPIFEDMESIIPFTSDPRVSSMTYLARYGSSVSMLESLDNGLAILQYSKHHAENVVPCKETGMVYYIEVNLLSQQYEKQPDIDLKMKILKTAEIAMSQFTGENEAVQKDYQRMLMLKMVFCRLGIGLFGNQIENMAPDESDTAAAKEYLDFIERRDVWKGMEKRRKMLFLVAKSEFYRLMNQYEFALPLAKEAVKLATENNWKAELPNIRRRLANIEQEKERPPVEQDEIDPIETWLEELGDTENDSNEMGNIRQDTSYPGQIVYKRPNMDTIHMAELKVHPGLHETPSGNKFGEHDNSVKSMTYLHERDNDPMISMELLKQGISTSDELGGVSDIRMDSLKGTAGTQETGYGVAETYIGHVHNSDESDIIPRMEYLKNRNEVEHTNGASSRNGVDLNESETYAGGFSDLCTHTETFKSVSVVSGSHPDPVSKADGDIRMCALNFDEVETTNGATFQIGVDLNEPQTNAGGLTDLCTHTGTFKSLSAMPSEQG